MADELGISNARALEDRQRMMVDDNRRSGFPDATTPAPQPPAPANKSTLAMFVPVRDDLTRPFDDAPRSRLDRARATLQAIDTHRTGVRRGIVHLGLLEQQRILAEMGPRRDADEERNPDIMGHEEADAMLATMRAPAVRGYDYSVTAAQMAQTIPLEWPPATGERPGGRREAVRQQQMLVERVLTELAGYEAHSKTMRAQWTSALEREQKRLQEQFGTPGTEEPVRNNGSGSGSGIGYGIGNGTDLGIATSLPGLHTDVGRAAADASKTASTEPAPATDQPTETSTTPSSTAPAAGGAVSIPTATDATPNPLPARHV